MTPSFDSSYRTIPLTCGYFAKVDLEDYDSLISFKWRASKDARSGDIYAVSTIEGKEVKMARRILGLISGDGLEGEHRSHETLDNRRSNLRVATRAQNAQNRRMQKRNTSGFKGVYKRLGHTWNARICVGGKHLGLGHYKDPETAARAYDAAAKLHHGEFACLNFPEITQNRESSLRRR